MTKDEAIKKALTLLNKKEWEACDYISNANQAADILEEALAQSEQVPMNYYRADEKGNLERTDIHSAQRTWVEIDGDDWIKALDMADFDKVAAFEFFENKLKELNT